MVVAAPSAVATLQVLVPMVPVLMALPALPLLMARLMAPLPLPTATALLHPVTAPLLHPPTAMAMLPPPNTNPSNPTPCPRQESCLTIHTAAIWSETFVKAAKKNSPINDTPWTPHSSTTKVFRLEWPYRTCWSSLVSHESNLPVLYVPQNQMAK